MNYITEFATDCRIRGFTKHTIESYTCNLNDFLNTITDPTTVTQVDLRAHLTTLQQRHYRASTYKSYYAALNAFFDFLIFEELVSKNPIPAFRKRYIAHIMKTLHGETRQIINTQDMRQLIEQAKEIEDIAILHTLAKTGLRRGELLEMTRNSIDMDRNIINVPHKAKRQIIFIDQELHDTIEEYLQWRDQHAHSKWLWVSQKGGRVHKDYPGKVIAACGQNIGLHDPDGPLDKKLTPHCFRHFFTTELFKAGMDPQYIKWLRGDSMQKEAWQVYNHIDPETVRAEYERCIPQLLTKT